LLEITKIDSVDEERYSLFSGPLSVFGSGERASYISIRAPSARIIYVRHGAWILAHVQHVIIKFWKRAAQRTAGLPSTAANLGAFHAGPAR